MLKLRGGAIHGIAVVALVVCAGCREQVVFQSDVETRSKPWTHLEFRNNPDNFQFAIVADRTGGARAGVFESAVDKLNLLQPEFVITVGDMIEGYTDDEARLAEQWEAFTGFVKRLDMPFFFLPGNHDNLSPAMRHSYLERFGRTYYAFVYRDVLFLALDSQDADPGFSAEQVAWAISTLQQHASVRWTLVFMHQPLWVYEEGSLRTSRKKVAGGQKTGFGEIQAALGNRPHTVFAGHFHQYAKFERASRNYYILATTGGQSELRGPGFGEFDHAVWVTLTSEGPVLANLRLDGILPADVHTEAHLHLEGGLAFESEPVLDVAQGAALSLPVPNPFGHLLHAEVSWALPEDGSWTAIPSNVALDVPSFQTNVVEFVLRYTGDAWLPRPPRCTLRAVAGGLYMPEEPLPVTFPLDALLRAYRPTTKAVRAEVAPTIDGVLDDVTWAVEAGVAAFRRPDAGEPGVATRAWVTYDAEALYLAVHCTEPNLELVRTVATNRDDAVWADDSVEVFLGMPEDGYHHWAVSAAGVLYDGDKLNGPTFDGRARATAGRDATGWVVELAIPWSDLGGIPEGRGLSLALARNRTVDRSTQQYPPLNGGHHRHELHGRLELVP